MDGYTLVFNNKGIYEYGKLNGTGDLVPSGVKAHDVLKRKLNEMLAQHTGQSIETIERDTDRDNFMSAEDAVKYGLIDKVLKNRTESAAA